VTPNAITDTEAFVLENEELEKAAIRACLDQFYAAYSRGDAKSVANLYHPNANLVMQGQEVAVGHAAIEREYIRLIALDPVRSDTKVTQALRIHLVDAELAVVDAAALLTKLGDGGNEEKLGDAFFTIVVVKDDGRWLLAALRGASDGNISPP
jgi:uncharacterized protein (TIGR02246 family)